MATSFGELPSGGRAATSTSLSEIWVKVQLGSSSPHWTEWADNQHRAAGLESHLVPDLRIPHNPQYNRPLGH